MVQVPALELTAVPTSSHTMYVVFAGITMLLALAFTIESVSGFSTKPWLTANVRQKLALVIALVGVL